MFQLLHLCMRFPLCKTVDPPCSYGDCVFRQKAGWVFTLHYSCSLPWNYMFNTKCVFAIS